MNYREFLLKCIGYKKPTIFQMFLRRLEISYDRIYGLDFLSVISINELTLDKELVSKGSPSGNKFLYNLLKDLNIKDYNSILDIGCAKGSALKYFTKFSFNKVHGLELSNTLAEICRNNFSILKKNNVKVYTQNATEFRRFNDYDFFYLYNPFPEKIMIKVINQLKQQVSNKEITIIYNNPVCHDIFVENEFYFLKKYPDMWGNGISIYSNKKDSSRLKKATVI